MPKQHETILDSQQSQMLEEGSETFSKRAVKLVSGQKTPENLSLEKLRETYGSDLVDNIRRNHPDLSTPRLEEFLKVHS